MGLVIPYFRFHSPKKIFFERIYRINRISFSCALVLYWILTTDYCLLVLNQALLFDRSSFQSVEDPARADDHQVCVGPGETDIECLR